MHKHENAQSRLALVTLKIAAYALLIAALAFLVWSADRKVELSQPAVTLVIVALAAVLIAELLPRIQSVKLSATGIDIGLQDLSKSLNDQILDLTNRLGTLQLQQSAALPASRRSLQATKPFWKEAPAVLTEAGPFEDDTRKGKFGGRREAAGLRIDAEFPRSGRDWAEVRLTVRDKAGDDGVPVTAVEFFLDETFDAPRIKVPMIDGKAQLTITSWGGFTVGVWAPERDATLELDLSKLRNAPRVIREE